MKKSIRYLLLLFVCLGWQESYTQVYKFSTSGFSVLTKNEKGKWNNWSEFESTNYLVSLDTNKNRIVIFSENIELFEIKDYLKTTETETDIVYSFFCIDNDNLDCNLLIIVRKNQDNRKQLYINYDDKIIVHNIFNAD